VGGVRKRCRVPLEWVCGNILGGGGRSLAIWFILMWGIGHMLVSGMIGGVGIDLLKQCFPVLFSIVSNKDAMVMDNLVVRNGVI
jgi:hypothetical protein